MKIEYNKEFKENQSIQFNIKNTLFKLENNKLLENVNNLDLNRRPFSALKYIVLKFLCFCSNLSRKYCDLANRAMSDIEKKLDVESLMNNRRKFQMILDLLSKRIK